MRQQTTLNIGFLKHLRLHPEGLPPELWPRASAVMRWLDEEPFGQQLEQDRSLRRFLARVADEHNAREAMRQISQAMEAGELSQVGPLLRVAKGH